ncbi:MAG: hypothetical protein IJ326_05180 [Lachnospiraceae bacterium]|nr:hypothetical protein [Lachnospiraceae bacterium]
MLKRWVVSIVAAIMLVLTPMQVSAAQLAWSRTESSALLWTVADAVVYNGCSTDTTITKVLGVIPAGSFVQITGYCDSGTELFCAINYQNMKGYVSRAALDAPVRYEVIRENLSLVSRGSLTGYTQEQLAKLIVSAIVLPEMTQMQKAAAIHDYLCMTVSYDETLSKYSTMDALVGGSGVCQSYANAFNVLATAAGLESDFLGGFVLENGVWICHAWNRCLVDGQYYYLDVTWDDEGTFAGRKLFWTTDATLGGTHYMTMINPKRVE